MGLQKITDFMLSDEAGSVKDSVSKLVKKVTVSPTAPDSPNENDTWIDTSV